MTECRRCKYASVADKPRTIIEGNTTIQQSKGGIRCRSPYIKELVFDRDGAMHCSNFEIKKGLMIGGE